MEQEERPSWKADEFTTCDRCGRSMPAGDIVGRCAECKRLICKICHRGNCNICDVLLCKDHAHVVDDVVYCKSHAPAAPEKKRCFIATAAYGSPSAREIEVLRDFRDTFLIQSMLGRCLVRAYYYVSPPIADIIAEHNILRAMVREVLKPIISAVSLAKSNRY